MTSEWAPPSAAATLDPRTTGAAMAWSPDPRDRAKRRPRDARVAPLALGENKAAARPRRAGPFSQATAPRPVPGGGAQGVVVQGSRAPRPPPARDPSSVSGDARARCSGARSKRSPRCSGALYAAREIDVWVPRRSPRPEFPKRNGARVADARAKSDTATLRALRSKVADLNATIEQEGSTVSQARLFALKKQLARARADTIRFERQIESPRAG